MTITPYQPPPHKNSLPTWAKVPRFIISVIGNSSSFFLIVAHHQEVVGTCWWNAGRVGKCRIQFRMILYRELTLNSVKLMQPKPKTIVKLSQPLGLVTAISAWPFPWGPFMVTNSTRWELLDRRPKDILWAILLLMLAWNALDHANDPRQKTKQKHPIVLPC